MRPTIHRATFVLLLFTGAVLAQEPEGQSMRFNFQDADIHAVIKAFSQITGRNFLVDPRVKGTVTIISARPVEPSAAYGVLLSALRAQGFTAVESAGGITRIVPETEGRQGAPLGLEQPRRGDRWVTQVIELQNASASQLVPILRPLISANAQLAAYPQANLLVLTEYAGNVRNVMEVVARMDRPSAWEVSILPLQHASALDLAAVVGRLDAGAATAPGQTTAAAETRLQVIPDVRTNSLLVRSDNPGTVQRIRLLVAKLDVEAKRGGNARVVYLHNAEAAKIAEVLRGLLAGEARAAAAAGGAAGAPPRAQEASLVQADEATNSLIISAPDAAYQNLRAVIEKLDIRRAQVFVEALVAEVSADKAEQLGVQWAAGRNPLDAAGASGGFGFTNFPASGSGIVQTALDPSALAGAGGLTLGFVRGAITLPDGRRVLGLTALARALEQVAYANVLSTPNLLTLDNVEAKIVIGQNVPFLTGRFTQPAGAPAINPFETIERKDIGLTLRIKPQISEGGSVKLQLYQEVSSIAPAVTTAQDIVTNKRALETTVLIDDGNIVVLGGLIEDRVGETVQGVPGLSRIPLLGALFRYREMRTTKTNLMVFLRPVIVRQARDSEEFTQRLYDFIREQEKGRSPGGGAPAQPLLPELAPAR